MFRGFPTFRSSGPSTGISDRGIKQILGASLADLGYRVSSGVKFDHM